MVDLTAVWSIEFDEAYENYIDVAMPKEYFDLGLENVGFLNDGRDFVTNSVQINSCVNRAHYSDKMKQVLGD